MNSAFATIVHLALAVSSLAVIALPKPYATGVVLLFWVAFGACLIEFALRMRREGLLSLSLERLYKRVAHEGARSGLALESLAFTLSSVAVVIVSLR